jgi:adenylate kinase
MYIILLGPPGVGKGTQGAFLAESQGWDRVVTGDLLRMACNQNTDLGREAKHFMDAGDLVPDDVMIALVKEKFGTLPTGKGIVLDGFPRTSTQASSLSLMLSNLNIRIDQVVVLQAEDLSLVQRISGRRSCPKCGAIYNTYLSPPIEDGVCDNDKIALQQRTDDQFMTVNNRLEVYRGKTVPLIDYYEIMGIPVHYIDGEQSIEDVQKDIVIALGLVE